MGQADFKVGDRVRIAALHRDAQRHLILRTNLLNQGLGPHLDEVAAAYSAAMAVGANAEDAWEAARRHAVLRAWQAAEAVRSEAPPRSDVRAWTGWDEKHRLSVAAREARFVELLALPNPFAVQERAA